eukprot:TRINITY_DN4124_c0_g1_i2.p1 TRINITY_DN4124_c0_g1~~TRINITY_DN4124_c0_g1_i2.p1  ORF type:complete len:447 (+),score=32.07 TRINITY_DN4124_c0_g1_i2:830-2170(+)
MINAITNCAQNRTGLLCGKCLPGHSEALGSSTCIPDTACEGAAIGIVGLGLLAALVYIGYLLLVPRGNSGHFKVMLYYYQVLFTVIPKSSTSILREYMGLFGFKFSSVSNLNMNGSFEGLFCLITGLKTYQKIALDFAGPVIMLLLLVLLFGIYWIVIRRCKKTEPGRSSVIIQREEGQEIVQDWHALNEKGDGEEEFYYITFEITSLRQRFVAAFTSLIILSYTGFTYTSLQLLNCIDINGESRLWLAAEEVKCYLWWQYVLIAVILVVLFPLPLWIALWRRRVRRKALLTSPNIAALIVLEWPYRRYRRWWESVRLFRRFLLVGLYTLIADPFLRSFLLCLTSAAILATHLHFKPFKEILVHWAENASLFFLFLLSLMNLRSGSLATAGVINPIGNIQHVTGVLLDITTSICMIIPLLYSIIIISVSLFQRMKSFIVSCLNRRG